MIFVYTFSQILRRIVQKPALAGFSIAALSLGLAATTAIYCIVDAVVLTPKMGRVFPAVGLRS